ncbi:MAG TPA: pantoate--beta-alanine ligase [Ktedonobacteraceae bacterium]|nr:pantoate--beta-alanine ligase [Ktedonobacteraceae bacterium]
MRTIDDLKEMTETARGWLAGGSVGFVCLMSSLHEGHRKLVQAAREGCEIVVVCILYNWPQPAAIGAVAQPRWDLTTDLQDLNNLGVDVIFLPRFADLYPSDFATYVTPMVPLAQRLEGPAIPNVIRDFATTITKLFELVRPDIAYFGRKDAQQIAVIRRFVRDLNIDVSLRVIPTVREADGLALSSRNRHLSPAERQQAPALYQALLAGKALIEGGERRSTAIEQAIAARLAASPLVALDCAALCHPDALTELTDAAPGCLLAAAVQVGAVRLIDNILWAEDGQWIL